jgi:hypothetical protein
VAAALLLAPLAVAGEVQVRSDNGRVDVVAKAAALQDVLARLAEATGMKVVYEGASPRTQVTVSLHGRTPAEAVLGLLEGQGLNYLLKTDRTGTTVDTLILTPASGGSASASRPTPAATPLVASDPTRGGQRQRPPFEERDAEPEEEERPNPQPRAPGASPAPPPPSFSGPIPGPGQPGSPFAGQVAPLTLPTPVLSPQATPAPPQAQPQPTPTPSPGR